ncbi:MAG: phosphatase PAP2 family protein [Rickettsiaceae bacterium]|nr:phosphatase PAP2 family protein [Rickettsiaceae bacterium]
MINNRLVNICLVSTALLSIILVVFPQFDITISNIFYSKKQGFIYRDNIVVIAFFKSIPLLTKTFSFICVCYLAFMVFKHHNIKKIISSAFLYLLITVAIGPGITVNYALKENFGRARPKTITEFNGNKEFSRAFAISDQCSHNCSFSSGHAAMGYYFTAISYVTSAIYFQRIYLAGIFFGSLVGLSRIIMGGHFLSDVVVSCFIILLVNHLTYILWQKIKLKYKK